MKQKGLENFGMQVKEYWLKLFPPGKQIEHNGKIYTVDRVKLIGYKAVVKFVGLDEEYDIDNVYCEPTLIYTAKI